MMRAILALLLLVGSVGCAAAQSSEALKKPYSISMGEVIALALPQILSVTGPTGLPVMTGFDKPSQTIGVFVYDNSYGGSSVDAGKKTLERYREKLTDPISKVVESMYGVKLSDKDFTLMYFSGGKEIVRREGGQYVIK